jgi:hypothetical protein
LSSRAGHSCTVVGDIATTGLIAIQAECFPVGEWSCTADAFDRIFEAGIVKKILAKTCSG